MALLLSLSIVGACANDSATEETRVSAVTTTSTLSLSLPNSEFPQRLALGAATNLTIGDRSKVLETSGGLSTVSSVGTEQTQFGVSSSLGNVWSAPSVFLQSNSTVAGFLNTGGTVTQQTGVSIAGPIAQTTITSAKSLTSWTVAFPQGGTNIQLQPGQQQTLAPGGYGMLSAASGAQVKLSAGTYFFASFDLEPSAQLILNETAGPVLVYVQNNLLYKGIIVHSGGGPGDFLLGCPACSDISLQGSFSGTLVAPAANVTLTTVTGGHTGSFFANRLTVNPDVTVRHQTFRHWDLITAPNCPATAPLPTTSAPFSFCNGGNVGRLPPAIDPTVSRRVVDGFRWGTTTPVRNFGADGNPTLWYAWIYVEDKADLETLDQLEIHWDTMPFFDVERDAFSGMSGMTTSNFDGEGGFVFAVIPGPTYNLIREAALCSDPTLAVQVFRAIVFPPVPVPEAKNADGSLSYQFLGTDGFRYRGLPNCPSDDQLGTDTTVPEAACDSPFLNPPAGGDPVLNALMSASSGSGLTLACSPADGAGAVQQPWGFHLGKLVKKFVKGVHNVVHGVADLGRKGLAAVSKFFKGSTTLTVNLEIRNSDPGFGGANTLMLRAWGANRGLPVPLPGVQVRALQQISFSVHPHIPSIKIPGTNISTPGIMFPKVSGTIPFDSLSTGTSNASGTATIKVVKSSTTGICVRLENAAAEIDDWVSTEEACSFKNPVLSASDLTGPKTITVPLAGDLVNVLAQASEAYGYMQKVVGPTPKKLNVLTGFFADKLSKDGRAYTPCFGYAQTSAVTAAIGGKLGQAGGAFVGDHVETYLKDAANKASEKLDAWADALDKWSAAQQAAAGTAAGQAVSAAVSAVSNAKAAADTARTAAAVAAEAAATLTEAATVVLRDQQQGSSAAAIAAAKQAVSDALNTAKTATDAATQAAQAAQVAANQALTAVEAAFSAAGSTTAAAVVSAAADAARIAGTFDAVLLNTLGSATAAILPLIGQAVGSILGFIVGEIGDVIFGDVDMVLPPGSATLSRGVATHEYGHFAFCDTSYRTDPGKFDNVWVDTASDTIVTQFLKRDGSQVEDYFLNEGIADFFAAQVAGGVNYFNPAGSSVASVSGWTDQLAWCRGTIVRSGSPMPVDDKPLRCIEDNFGAITTVGGVSPNIAGTSTVKQATGVADLFRNKVAFVASTIHDAFDGWPNSPAANLPGNGAAWIFQQSTGQFAAPPPPFTTSTNFFQVVGSLNDTAEFNGSVIHEESVSLTGSAYPAIIREWLRREPSGAALRQETFFRGLTQVMLDAGTPSDEACRLYDLHQPTDTCPDWGPSGVSPAPAPPLNLCPGGAQLTNGQCACPPGTVLIDGTCQIPIIIG